MVLLFILSWSCATYQPPPPSLYIGNLPAAFVTELSLDERILIEDAWNSLKKGDVSKAERSISKLGEKNPVYYIGFGFASMLLGNMQYAEGYFKTALSYYPDMAVIHSGLAQVYQKTGREDEAFAEFREVLKKEPDNLWAKQQYEALKSRKTQEVMTEAKQALAAGNTEKSKQAYLRALHYSPQSTEAHLRLAEIYKMENNRQNALIHLKAASANEPKNKDILKNYAESLFQAERYARSLEIYEELEEMEPDNKEIASRIESIKNALGVIELPSQYNSIPFSESVTKEEMAALLAVKFKGTLETISSQPPIIIDIATSWASKFILQISSLGILDIYPNHTFQPKKIITRAEMAEILIRFIHYLEKKGHKFIRQIQPEKIQISDVSPQNYYYKPIVEILSFDIMDLTPDREFKTDSAVSGQEAVKLLDIILALIR